jgi:hypothetical protein
MYALVTATQEVEIGGSCSEISLGKKNHKTLAEKIKQQKNLGEWLKW